MISQQTMYLVGAIFASFALAFAVWFIWEVITAPLLDEQGNVIEDKWGRMGPPLRPLDRDEADR